MNKPKPAMEEPTKKEVEDYEAMYRGKPSSGRLMKYLIYFAVGLFTLMLVLFALWLLDAPIIGGVPTQPDCAIETAACYETMRGFQIDLEMCDSDLASCQNGIQVLQGQYDKAWATPTPNDELQWYCDPYTDLSFEALIEESSDFLILSNLEVWSAMHLVECCKYDDAYCEALLGHLIEAEELQKMYLDEIRPDWSHDMLEIFNLNEIDGPTS